MATLGCLERRGEKSMRLQSVVATIAIAIGVVAGAPVGAQNARVVNV